MFKDLAVKTRLKLFAALVITIQTLLALFVILKLVEIESHVKEVEYSNIPVIEQVSLIQQGQTEQAALFEQAFRLALEKQLGLGQPEHFQQVVTDFERLGNQIDNGFRQAKALINQAYFEAGKIPGTTQILGASQGSEPLPLAKADHSLAMIKQHYLQLEQKTWLAIVELKKQNLVQAEHLLPDIEQKSAAMRDEVAELNQSLSTLIQMNIQGVEAETRALEWGVLLASGICMLITLFVSVVIIRRIDQGLAKAERGLKTLADGDFSRAIEHNEQDEIGLLLSKMEQMRLKVGALLEMVRRSSFEVNDAATSLAAVSHQVQSNTHIQAKEVSQVNQAIQQLAVNTSTVTDDSIATQNSTEEAAEESNHSLAANDKAGKASEQLMANLQNSVQTFEQLEHTSTQMNEMLDTIKGVAEQTNLLALNAAIEAARAGEQGRGFAVVADEVRQLAMRTQNSAEQITELVERFAQVSRQAADGMLKNRDIGRQTLQYSEQATERLNQVNSAIVTVRDMNMRIARAAQEQNQVAETVSGSMAQVNQTVEEGAAMVDQIAAACLQLSDTAGQLQGEINYFRLAS